VLRARCFGVDRGDHHLQGGTGDRSPGQGIGDDSPERLAEVGIAVLARTIHQARRCMLVAVPT
jgi:hypothetical protein